MVKHVIRFVVIFFMFNALFNIALTANDAWQVVKVSCASTLLGTAVFVLLAFILRLVHAETMRLFLVLAAPFGFLAGLLVFEVACAPLISAGLRFQAYFVAIFSCALIALCEIKLLEEEGY